LSDPVRTELSAALAVQLHDVMGKLRRRLREQTDAGDLPPSQVNVLRRLEREGPITVSALARAAGIRSQSMGATVAALQSAGLVAGAPDPADGRQTLLSLTPACRK
jgi:DNA-binding MarR family transcriptional regulator